jgi:hypothetical protein
MTTHKVQSAYIVLVVVVLIVHMNGQVNAQSDSTLYAMASRLLISEMDLMFGYGIIYPSVELAKENLVPKYGWTASVGFTHKFSSEFSLALRLAYENKGEKKVYKSLNEDYNPPAQQKAIRNITMNYVTAALIPRVHPFKKADIYFGAGPYLGYLVNTKLLNEVYINGQLVSKSGSHPDPDEYFGELDFGLTAMIGYNFKLTPKMAGSVQLLCNFGLVDVGKTSGMQNNTYAVSCGLSLPNL